MFVKEKKLKRGLKKITVINKRGQHYGKITFFTRDGRFCYGQKNSTVLHALGIADSPGGKDFGSVMKKNRIKSKTIRKELSSIRNKRQLSSKINLLKKLSPLFPTTEEQLILAESRWFTINDDAIAFLGELPKHIRQSHTQYSLGYLYDILRMLNLIEKSDPSEELKKSIEQKKKKLRAIAFHDFLSGVVNKLKHKNIRIPYDEDDKKFESDLKKELDNTNLTIDLAKNTHEIVDWGIQNKHCIGGYVNSALKKIKLLFKVSVDGEMKYNISFTGYIQQFKGYCNCDPKEEHNELVRKAFKNVLEKNKNNTE